ncbi:SLC13 family permease [Parafannyhessea umbonata]|uniref:Di-and tricarboxylate transporter n=1 Tax=Parafannyhessea umbonata TaxID=604330 RepID=A0A1G6JFB0_9ACTN|nr:SLC13 family permease [Parafannyhessea umbonata]SDC17390.1 Di-and tricarboxylate transporter [Parafannyhessea umbonata]
MTVSMILALVVLVAMIAMIMFDVLPFGLPPIAACLLIVIFGLGGKDPIAYAFAGFTNSTVWMLAFFMVILAAIQKTSLINKVKDAMTALVNKGGFKSYVLLLIVVMLGASLVGMGSTAFYVLIFSLVVTMPYNEKLPGSKLMLPLGIASNHPLIPINVALQYGVAVAVLGASGLSANSLPMVQFGIVSFILSIGFLLWAIVGYKFLPSHPVAEPTIENKEALEEGASALSPAQETVTILSFVVAIIAMMLVNVIGPLSYIIPGICAFVMVLTKVVDFAEFRDNLFSPIILMTAGVIPVANCLADTGLSTLVGNTVAHALGAGVPAFVVVFVFALLCSTFACFTGSQVGMVMIFAPLAISVCQGLGINPMAAAVAVTLSAWCGHYMPIDGLPAMAYGMGKYTMPEFWKFTIPMYFVRLVFLTAGAMLVFPA